MMFRNIVIMEYLFGTWNCECDKALIVIRIFVNRSFGGSESSFRGAEPRLVPWIIKMVK